MRDPERRGRCPSADVPYVNAGATAPRAAWRLDER